MIQQIDAPLREDVRLLGNLLGETLKEHAGQDLFNQVEQIRALSKGARDGQVEAEKQLEQLFFSLEDDEILPLTRAFTHFLNFANIAEQYHVVRSRRQSEFDETAPSPNPLDHLFAKFKNNDISTDTLFQQICDLNIELVLTAHPTEVSRRTLIQKYDGINDALFKMDQQKLTPRERQTVLEDLKQLICSAWQCGHVKYKTFATLLIQNLQKGSRHMGEMLEKESVEAWDDRKRKAKVQGEAATTKLLFPMILMLGVVMAIVMLPACLSFYG